MSNSNGGYVRIHREMLKWEWYRGKKNLKVKSLFLHCLLRANWESGEWDGICYEPGQFITSISTLAEETGLSKQEIRTCLNKLESTGEISTQIVTQKATHVSTQRESARCTVITVNNWSKYQKATRKATQKATQKSTTDKKYKERKDAASLPKGAAAAVKENDDGEFHDAHEVWEQMRRERDGEGNL